jgi:hypothetical protein
MSDMKLFTDGEYTVNIEKGLSDLYYIIKEKWSVGPNQVKFVHDEINKHWRVRLTNKTGETFTEVGAINFNPNED